MKPKGPISPKEEEILSFIVRYCQETGYPPTVREIGKAVGLHSSCSVHYHLRKLEEKGFIRRKPAKPRAIELVSVSGEGVASGELVLLPLLREVVQTRDGVLLTFARAFFPFPKHLVGDGECFVFLVQDGAFSRWHILEGDYLLVERGSRFEGEALLFLVSRGRVFLEQVSLWEGKEESTVNVVGRVVGVWRRL
ncbi:MAG: repressor LexA [Candidatus Caldatribacterium sp.]|uniref:LexA family protein n=1 Tax=Candidatus Caldatribacterium sp. TaxID=2282143 RepID=UPI002996FA64|nr:repressor LexA [Candidatus Caldatribacterium sp.]MCX7731252.1 repressor LexA [Candidatus Caldatribacterium sp.]MDW8080373.1 repressor LexA [Candidatus Calescibacterium sp.]